jgi:hypothetical protein
VRAVIRGTFALCLALLLAGVGGLIARGSTSSGHPSGPAPAVTATTAGGTAPATTTPPVVPSAAALAANLLVPDDLGGYYHPVPSESAPQWAGSGCLAPLGQPPGMARQAVQFLEGPYFGGLPLINEQLDAFATLPAATSAYRALAATLGSCRAPTVAVYTNQVSVPLTPFPIPALGDQDDAVQGTYHLHGRTEQLTVAVVRTSATIVVFAYADTVPASNAILGDVTSTVRAAVGKAA